MVNHLDIYTEQVHFIAEIGINHNGDLELAKEMILLAKDAGAKTVKFQFYDVDIYIDDDASKPDYQKQSKYKPALSQKEIIREAQLTLEELLQLKDFALKEHIGFLVTPFEEQSLLQLAEAGIKEAKVSSDNLTNIPFLRRLASSTIDTVILSTGMGDFGEVLKAFQILSHKNIMLMQCTSNYPSPTHEANTSVLGLYKDVFDVPLGFSDHTTSEAACASALVFGAKVFEKHFTKSRDLPGIDQKASLEPAEFRKHVEFIEDVNSSIGTRQKAPTLSEESTRKFLRRSLFFARSMAKGEKIAWSDLVSKRPGTGLSPTLADTLVDLALARDVEKGEPLKITDFG